MNMDDRNAKDLLEWLTGHSIEERIPDEEVLEELCSEGIDLDALVTGARAALRRIHDKVRLMGIPLENLDNPALEGDEA
jgi:hypothetical protein